MCKDFLYVMLRIKNDNEKTSWKMFTWQTEKKRGVRAKLK